jgi:tRNA nucleotidyltransferase/poly(A) polymerase
VFEPPELPELVAEVRDAAGAAPLWLVGGVVRDLLLKRRVHDFDFVTAGDGLAIARAAADRLGAPYFPLDSARGVGRVVLQREGVRVTVDVAQLRGPDLGSDLAARDFTINGMAIDTWAPEALIDPLGGQGDLRAKVVRACSPTSMADDPVRTIRAVRLAAQLQFRLDPATRAAARAAADGLASVSAERRRDEFVRCVGGPRAPAAVRALETLGLMPYLVPELATIKAGPDGGAAWEQALGTLTRLQDLLAVLHPVHDVDAASDLTLGLVSVRLGRHRAALGEHLEQPVSDERPVRWLLMLAGLLQALERPEQVRERLTELRFSSEEARRTVAMVGAQREVLAIAQALPVGRRTIYRYFRDWRAAGVEAVLLALARYLGALDGPPAAEAWNAMLDAASALLRGYFEAHEAVVAPAPLLTGDDLIAELGLKPGPKLGELLEALREAQAAGEVGDREAALTFARGQVGVG